MSNYENFIQDFPKRCGEILDEYNNQAKKSGWEVTHLLAIASVAITIPFERLRKPKDGFKHPANDRKIYQEANSKYANLCDRNFIKSKLWNGEPNAWRQGIVEGEKVNNEPESWITNAEILPPDYKVKCFLSHIRNAISHANIYTSSDAENNIIDLIFLNRIFEEEIFNGKYSYIIVSVENFNKFLINWIKFLAEEIKLKIIE